jgi:putative oxidoreductase
MTKQTDTFALVGRILIGVLFLMAGISKLGSPAATQGYIAAVGLPAPVAAYFCATGVELIGSVLLIAGYQVRVVASWAGPRSCLGLRGAPWTPSSTRWRSDRWNSRR